MNDKTTQQRIVVTGMGVVCPLGHDVETVWHAMLNGQSGAAPTTLFDASTMPTQFSAEVKDFDLSNFIQQIDRHQHGNRGSQFIIAATAQACAQAGIKIETEIPQDAVDRTRLGIYLGSGEGSVDNRVFFDAIAQAWRAENQTLDWPTWAQVAFDRMDPMHELEQESNMPGAHLAVLTGARGPSRCCLTACAASTQAVGEAASLLRSGEADLMIAGGAHSMIHPLGIMGFNRLTALSTRNESPTTASRPFSASRDGFVIGEGAAVLILETLSSAQKRAVPVLAEIIGYGSSADAFRVTDMHDEARGPTDAILAAIKDAQIDPNDIDYINAHGTSTSENDAIETLAIKRAFGSDASGIPVSSVKSSMGHLIGAAGAAELIACIMAIRDQILPPTLNLNDPDPQLDLDYVPNQPRKTRIDIAMNESFGFGGQNNVVIVKRFSK